MITYRGFYLHRSGLDWYVTFPDGNVQTGGPRTRWGTLAEVRADVDAYLSRMDPDTPVVLREDDAPADGPQGRR